MRSTTFLLALLALLGAPAQAQDFREFRIGARGIVVRVSRPANWQQAATDDEQVLAELRGAQGPLTGILQIGLGLPREDAASLCQPERAPTMLQQLPLDEADARVTDVVARRHEGRPGYELRYERNAAPAFLRVQSLVVCVKDTRVLVSCAAFGSPKSALAQMEPVCRRVMESLRISEE
jgi:hypothetical protein